MGKCKVDDKEEGFFFFFFFFFWMNDLESQPKTVEWCVFEQVYSTPLSPSLAALESSGKALKNKQRPDPTTGILTQEVWKESKASCF